ncbi:MAG: hypothetical protein NDP13_03460 [Crenarchaeota archaeon]|nr:hypothetical protein [Thermoproteota archaeon]MCR8454027.1 hypothetical protein [Thermoproteota archaeon]MCR8454986.1 hypothetical protein [Thermoproteota archaeon]MCR8463391.1 hypothetical protein [Thermoproteota archaeon]MCR8470434.1 hypothetical protein [Thermoproteota archaeon]
MLIELLKIDQFLTKLKRTHPSNHKERAPIIKQMTTVVDNWISRNNLDSEENLFALAQALEYIDQHDRYAYEEMRQITKYPKIYERAINYMKWAQLHKRLGGKLPVE